MTWHYRILRHPDGSLALHEVYCDDEGKPNRCTTNPISFGADENEGLDGIVVSLRRALADATDRAVLDFASFGPPHPEKADEKLKG